MMKAGEMYQVMIDGAGITALGVVECDEDSDGFFRGWELHIGGSASAATAGKFYGLSLATHKVREFGRQQIVRLVPEPLAAAAPMLRQAPQVSAPITPLRDFVDGVVEGMR